MGQLIPKYWPTPWIQSLMQSMTKPKDMHRLFAKSRPILKLTKKNVTVSNHGLKLINLTSVLFHSGWLKQ
ncbi:hypothetical protein A2p33 [Lactobacillus phage A2]|uniref:Uncharacterized protein n=1 Tax=Lactobacillus phage A2 TaxID=51369 RepID=Q9T0Y6_9CAUD|nr:hypothetical protein A2p33 [Lactobacillus phage A2]CAB63667.1 hypothetical protein [Lactobacillus phage A2]